ncbi:MAG: S8 family serine peptidase [Caldilinea sp.]
MTDNFTLRSALRALMVMIVLLAVETSVQPLHAEEDGDFVPGEIVVKLLQPGDLPGVAADFSLDPTPLDQFGARPIYRLRILDGTPPPDKAEALQQDSRVLYAEPNYIQQTPEGQQRVSWARGGDSDAYATQWAGAFIGLPAAHSVTRGAGMIVAVLDTGVDRSHPALAGRVLPGFDFVDMDSDPNEVGVAGEDITYGHGTHVAGLVALAAPEAQILPVRVLDRDGAGNIWVLAEALAYAVNPDGDINTPDGAHVINLSLSTRRQTRLIEEIVRDVICEDDDDDDDDGDDSRRSMLDDDDDCLATPGRGAVVIAAAGNRASTLPEYPAAETQPGLLAVAANTDAGTLADFSNFGAWVHVAAPGDRIMSSVPGNDYGVWSGTSMAAPLAAGQAALVRAANPLLTAAQVAERIRLTASGPAGEPPRIDAAAALGLPRTQRPIAPGDDTPAHWLFLPAVTR